MLSSLVAVGIAAGLVIASAPAAQASTDDPPSVTLLPGTGGKGRDVEIHPRDPGKEGDRRGGKAKRVSDTPTRRTCMFKGATVPCTNVAGTWSAERGCWVQRYSPQPSKDYPGWKGHTDGAIYLCTPPDGTGESIYDFWAPDAGAAGAPQTVDPVDLAEEAIKAMHLRPVGIGITPPAGPDSYTLIGLPTWMWVDEPSESTWGPITRSASAGAVTVTATAHVSDVVWDMGDGTQVSCGRGTPYTAGHGPDPSPTCGHTYASPGRFDVSATSHWTVDWEGAGQAGTITLALTDDSSVWVRQAHGLISRQG
jgi:hypothetical protein